MRLILVRIWRDNLPKYCRAINKSLLGAVLTTSFGGSRQKKNKQSLPLELFDN